MNMMYRVFVIIGIVSGVLFATQNCYCAKFVKEKITVHLVNKLGADIQMDITKIEHCSTTPEMLCPVNNFLVKIRDDCYVAIPPSAFKEAKLENSTYNVILVNGQKLKGTLMGDITENVDLKYPRYDLSDATFLSVEFTAGTQRQNTLQTPVKAPDRWQLTCSIPDVSRFVLQKPQFGLVYESETLVTDRHNRTRVTDVSIERNLTTSFNVETADKLMPATISDFAEISLKFPSGMVGRGKTSAAAKPGSLEAAAAAAARRPSMTAAAKSAQQESASSVKVALVAANGVKTSGSLGFRYYDRYKYDLALVAEIEGTGGAVLILLSPQCTIKKIAPPKNATAAANPVPANAVKSEMP